MFWEVDCNLQQNDAREGKIMQISAKIVQIIQNCAKKKPVFGYKTFALLKKIRQDRCFNLWKCAASGCVWKCPFVGPLGRFSKQSLFGPKKIEMCRKIEKIQLSPEFDFWPQIEKKIETILKTSFFSLLENMWPHRRHQDLIAPLLLCSHMHSIYSILSLGTADEAKII